MSFAFENWRGWLVNKQERLKAEGLEVKVGWHDYAKPKIIISIAGKKATGDFESWKSGEIDYTVFKITRRRLMPWRKSLKQASYKWGILANDETFEETFDEFIARFREVETG